MGGVDAFGQEAWCGATQREVDGEAFASASEFDGEVAVSFGDLAVEFLCLSRGDDDAAVDFEEDVIFVEAEAFEHRARIDIGDAHAVGSIALEVGSKTYAAVFEVTKGPLAEFFAAERVEFGGEGGEFFGRVGVSSVAVAYALHEDFVRG